SGLHRKDKWLAFGTCLADGLTVRASAERCRFAVNTAFRWRHRFLTAQDPKAHKLTGIVEADETYFLQSQKGERNLARKARRRGGKASKRGLSDEQVPVLVAADRSGTTVSAVLTVVNADTLRSAIEPVVNEDIVLVSDGHRAYPPCAAALGVRHEALNLSGGERVRDAFHIQTVNSRHSQLKDFLRRYRGVATKYLDNYLRWFQRIELENASPRTCLATAITGQCIRIVN
ncbi:MAG: IS1595 family transposase, partial [Gammaproteobacteria bacterium]|nr:IS1595 family transposase [Gammaproteobacteria bacterium]